MLDFTEPEFDIIQAGTIPISCDVFACLGQHLRGHIHADRPARGSDLAGCDENVKAAAAPKVQDHLSRTQRCQGIRVAAG